MRLKRWSYIEQKYIPTEVGEGTFLTYTSDMDKMVTCPHCGKQFRFGNGYTSKVFHSELGFGYAVCPDCYWNKEMSEYKKLKLGLDEDTKNGDQK